MRKCGVLMPISSLPSPYGIGDLGKAAYDFIDFLEKCGFSYWQVLPFCMADECNSPYKSYSAFAGNPFFVDLKKSGFKRTIVTCREVITIAENKVHFKYRVGKRTHRC